MQLTQSSTHSLLVSFISCASFVPNCCSDCFSSSQNQLHYQHRPTPARLRIVCSLLFIILLMIRKFLPQLLYFQCWYILWNISGANTSDHCFQLCDIFSYFLRLLQAQQEVICSNEEEARDSFGRCQDSWSHGSVWTDMDLGSLHNQRSPLCFSSGSLSSATLCKASSSSFCSLWSTRMSKLSSKVL